MVKLDISQTLFKTAFSTDEGTLTSVEGVGAAKSVAGARARTREMVFVKVMVAVVLWCCLGARSCDIISFTESNYRPVPEIRE